MIVDVFPFYNELELLEYRLETLYPVVDKFVLVESTMTYRGYPKELIYEKNKNKFIKFSPKKVKTPSPKAKSKTPVSIPRSVLKSSKFNKFVQKFLIQPTTPVMLSPEKKLKWEKQYGNYYTRLNAARGKALSALRNRKRRGLPLFSPSPERPKSRTPSPRKPSPKMKTPVRSNLPKPVRRFTYKVQFNKNNRMKIKKESNGRVVYVNGGSISLDYLKAIAARYGVNIKGLRSKTNIANKIFRNNK